VNNRFPDKGVDSLKPLRRETNLSTDDAEIAAIFAEPLPPLSEIAVARIRRRLEAPDRSHSMPMWLRWAVAVAAALFLLETATAAAISTWPALKQRFWAMVTSQMPSSAKQHLVTQFQSSVLPSSPDRTAEARPKAPAVAPMEAPAPVPSVAPAEMSPLPSALNPATAIASRPAHKASLASAAPVGRPPSADAEIALYSHALSQLNVDHDPAAALGTLGVYAFKYPNGILRRESTIAQLKAEMMLGLDTQALGLLDAMNEEAFAGFPKGPEARLLRAELLVRATRCEEAIQALDQYLEASVAPEQRAEALLLRASCRSQLDDFEGSREDLRTYQRDFPNGVLNPDSFETMIHSP
jgi:hypothetical protein